MTSRCALVLLLLLHCEAVRQKHASNRTDLEGNIGFVKDVYTFGAPHVSAPAITDRNGGCFGGRRVVAFKQTRQWFPPRVSNEEDAIPMLLVFSKYEHPNIRTMAVHDAKDGLHARWECGKNPYRKTDGNPLLHFDWHYLNAVRRLKGYDRLKAAANVGLANSYEYNKDKVQKSVSAQGWNRAGTAYNGEDVMHLLQEKSSMRCILTFEGSDRGSDWITDIKVKRVSYCGLKQRVHLGFRDELTGIVKSNDFQTKIRPNLGKCSEVDVVGHSLGGATANLFAACIASQNSGHVDYDRISWEVSATSMI